LATDDGLVISGAKTLMVTLGLPTTHAVALASRARLADVSQGAYATSTLDGAPPSPLSPDHAHAVAALVRSTDRLAATRCR